jgi:hypothetical protein
MKQPGEPDELDCAVRRATDKINDGYRELLAAIEAQYAAGRGPSRIARHTDYTREHISDLHKNGSKTAVPRRRRAKAQPGHAGS